MFDWLKRREKRSQAEVDDYTARRRREFYASVADTLTADFTAARECAIGAICRVFALAEFKGLTIRASDLLPAVRRVLERGEAACEFWLDGDSLRVHHAGDFSLEGTSLDPMKWRYSLTRYAPTGSGVKVVSGDRVLHFRINESASRPWEGVAPLKKARSTSRLLGILDRFMKDDLKFPAKKVLEGPVTTQGGMDRTAYDMHQAMEKEGKVIVLPIGHALKDGVAPVPTEALVRLRELLIRETMAPFGVSAALYSLASSGGMSGLREGYRQLVAQGAAPLGAVIEDELSRKTGREVKVDFSAAMSQDSAGKARAFSSYVAAGMSKSEAAHQVGIDAMGETNN